MNVFETVMGPPLAAPETPALRRLRRTVVALASLAGAGVFFAGAIDALLGPATTGGVLAILIAATVVTGGFYFVGKARRDDAWLDHLIASGNEP